MIALIQRVLFAKVEIAGKVVGAIDRGILALVAVTPQDTEKNAARLVERIIGYRIFSDEQGKMNLSIRDIDGGILAVPQFTLAADTKKGMRPSFSSAASPERGKLLFDYLVRSLFAKYPKIATGQFGADMQVFLCNDGPVTFWLEG